MAIDGDGPELSGAMPCVINQNTAYVRKCSKPPRMTSYRDLYCAPRVQSAGLMPENNCHIPTWKNSIRKTQSCDESETNHLRTAADRSRSDRGESLSESAFKPEVHKRNIARVSIEQPTRIKACPKSNWIIDTRMKLGKKKGKENNATTSIQYPIVPLIEKERVLASMDGNLISLISNF